MQTPKLLFSVHSNSDFYFGSGAQQTFEDYLLSALLLEPNGVALPDNAIFSRQLNQYAAKHRNEAGGSWIEASLRNRFEVQPISLVAKIGAGSTVSSFASYYRNQQRIGHYGSQHDELPLLGARLLKCDLSHLCLEPKFDTGTLLEKLESLFSKPKDFFENQFHAQRDGYEKTAEIEAWIDHYDLFQSSFFDAKNIAEARREGPIKFHDIAVSELYRSLVSREMKAGIDVDSSVGFAQLVAGHFGTSPKKALAVASYIRSVIHWYELRDAFQWGVGSTYQNDCSLSEFLTNNTGMAQTETAHCRIRVRNFPIDVPKSELLSRTTGDFFIVIRNSSEFYEYRQALNAWRSLPATSTELDCENAARRLESKTHAYLAFVIRKLSPSNLEGLTYTKGLMLLRQVPEKTVTLVSNIAAMSVSYLRHDRIAAEAVRRDLENVIRSLIENPNVSQIAEWADRMIARNFTEKIILSIDSDKLLAFAKK